MESFRQIALRQLLAMGSGGGIDFSPDWDGAKGVNCGRGKWLKSGARARVDNKRRGPAGPLVFSCVKLGRYAARLVERGRQVCAWRALLLLVWLPEKKFVAPLDTYPMDTHI